MSSEQLADGVNPLDAELAATWDILKGYSGRNTDLGIARRFGGAAAAYSLRDIGAMNGRVVKVRRDRDDAVEDFSAGAIASGGVEQFAIGQDILDLYNNAAYFPTDADYFDVTSFALSGAFTISYDVVFTADSFGTNDTRILQDGAGHDLLTFTSANICKYRVGGSGGSVRTMVLSISLELDRKYSMIFARDASNNFTLTIDGTVRGTVTSSDSGDFNIERFGNKLQGVLLNININSGQHIYAGNGAENSNWLDTGSGTTANAVKNGTPVAFTGQGIDAFVDTWYDQSGNGNNVTQGTTGSQPLIIENGSIVKDGNNPTIKFDGTDDFLQITSQVLSNSSSGAVGLYSVVNSTASQAGYVAGSSSDDDGGKRGASIYAATTKFVLTNGISASTTSQDSIPITNGSSVLVSACYNNNATNTLQKNSDTTGYADGSSAYNFLASSSFTIGHRKRSAGTNTATNLEGTISEVLAFNIDTTSDRSEIQLEIQNYYNL